MLPQKGGTLKPPPPLPLPLPLPLAQSVSQMKSQRKMINWGGFCARQLPVSWEPRSSIEVRRVICTNISLLHGAALKNELITCEPNTPTGRTVGQEGPILTSSQLELANPVDLGGHAHDAAKDNGGQRM